MWKILKISCLIILLITVQCSKDDDLIVKSYDFAIYLLQNPELKIDDILTKALADQDSAALSAYSCDSGHLILF